MEMHQLRYAVAVARTGNFSRAAEQCNVSQPSLSQQILKLEEELGERLFDRTKREARPTPHGEAFLRRALRILGEVDAARRDAEEAKQLLSGTVTIGAIPTIAPYLLPGAIDAFVRHFPGIEIVVHEETTSGLLRLLQRHEIDFALMSPPFPMDRLEAMPLLEEELLLALPPRHPLGNKRTITAGDLAGERLIVLQEGHCLGDQVLGFCARGDLHPRISFRSAQLETIRSMVSAGMGISLVPAMATARSTDKEPLYRSFSGKKPRRTVTAVWPAQRPPGRAALKLLKILKNPAACTQPPG
jgi:LysR family hydrogen peroxide-inducible transcriptional activator